MKVLLMISTCVILCVLLAVIQMTLQAAEALDDNQLTPVESGFEKLMGLQFSSAPFFFLAALFVFFDMELLLLLVSVIQYTVLSFKDSIIWLLLLSFIIITLLMEWKLLGLKWNY